MGLYDRDYYREETAASRFAKGIWSASLILVIAHASAIFIDSMSGRQQHPIQDACLLTLDHFRNGEPWRALLYTFVQPTPTHGLLALIGIWMFGRHVEGSVGALRMASLFFGGVAVGGLLFVGLNYANLLGVSDFTPLAGSGGGVFALLVLGSLQLPDAEVLFFLPGPVPVRLKWAATIFGLLALLFCARVWFNPAAWVACAGGAAFGAFVGGVPFVWKVFSHIEAPVEKATRDRRPAKTRVARPKTRPVVEERSDESELDRLLAKISATGMDSLTSDEKAKLMEESERRRNSGGRS